jgi:erythromycin esterase
MFQTHMTRWLLLSLLGLSACGSAAGPDGHWDVSGETRGVDSGTPIDQASVADLPLGEADHLDTAQDGSDTEVAPQHPQGIFPLFGVAPDLGMDDLAPFGELVAQAPMVALGESIHTCKSYYQAKHRLVRYLVETTGFRVLAWETPWAEAQAVADYVATCQGQPEEVVAKNMTYTWAAQSVADLVEWLCEYNQEHPDDPVRFYGFDIQQPYIDGPTLVALMDSHQDEETSLLAAGIGQCVCAQTSSNAECKEFKANFGSPVAQTHEACLDALAGVNLWLDNHAASLTEELGQTALGYLKIHVIGLRAYQEAWFAKGTGDVPMTFQARDKGMADVLLALRSLEFPEAKVIVWGHDWHIAYATHEISEPAVPMAPIPVGIHAAKGMGVFLREVLGTDYLAIGMHAYQLNVNWPGLRIGDLPPHSAESLEGQLHSLGYGTALVSLQSPPGAADLFAPGETYPSGIFDNFGIEIPIVPADQYGALLFLDETEMMEALTP